MNVNFNILRIFLIYIILIPLIKSEISWLNTDIVIGLTVVNSKGSPQNCPSDYIPASGCDDNCDLNYGAGGNYIYLCQKKKKFKELSLEDKPISKIKTIYNSKTCGNNLNLILSDLNAGAGGDDIYLCYGTNEEDPSPITDIFIYIKGYNNVPDGYACEMNDLNSRSRKKGPVIYACYKKEKKIPKYIRYSEPEYDTNIKSITEIEAPDEVIYIDNDNYAGQLSQTITRKVSKTVRNSYSFNFNKTLSFITRLDFEYTFKIPITTSFSFYAQFDQNENLEKTHIEEQTSENVFKCTSPPKKHLMCKAFNSNYKVSLPYKTNISYHFYDDTEEIEEYQSELLGLAGTLIQFSSCCVKGCQNNDNNCTKEEINNYDYMSGTCPENYTGNNDSNIYLENMVVTDITIISSIYKYINCPSGYEVINSGCDKEGCNLNYFSEGNYTYLCQKKQGIKSLTEGEKPVKYLDILFHEEECKNSLKLINIDLNEGSEKDKIYLCLGREEKEEKEIFKRSFLDSLDEQTLQNPIVDFFIFIDELNEIPSGYECINKNLNRATSNDKTILLCYTRNYGIYALKNENDHNLTDDIVVSDLDIVHSKKDLISCPDGYEIVNKECNENGCDLNYGAGGEYIYLCQKKKSIKKLTIKENPVNKFKIIFNKNDHENLKLIDVNLNQETGGDTKIYLAYGYEQNEKLSPIVDFFIYIKEVNTIPEGYECDNNDLNKGAGGKFIYLCYKRNDNLPKEIIINNIDLSYNLSEKISLGLPERLTQIQVTSTTWSGTSETKVIESKSMEKSFDFYSTLDVSFSFLSLIELGFHLDFNISAGEEWEDSVEKDLKTEITCSAPTDKTMVCYPFITNFQVNIPYKASVTLINYNGNVMGRDSIEGYFKKVSASQISFKTCCLNNCCTGNKTLDLGKNCEDNEVDIRCEDIMGCFDR